ncbi:MAG: class I SAM-dependent methyltransferase [Thermoplasmata archaeon]|nr:class I SAM-dependent methyltransferase [Thermoplasmata archaeon]
MSAHHTRSPPSDSHVRVNRKFWESGSDEYDRRHRKALSGRHAPTWGLWRIPETSLRLLGPLRGKDVLEFGCGAARWSIQLARQGARPVALDASRSQLRKAQTLVKEAGVRVPLVHANAERLPFRYGQFDLVFCDWGAMTFCDPYRTVPECSRVLRPEGVLVFSTASPLRSVTFDPRGDKQSRTLRRPYFGQHRIRDSDTVEFQLPYGKWIDLFRANALSVERLVEVQPEPGQASSYLGRDDRAWARRWPMEAIWRTRKDATPTRPRRRPSPRPRRARRG